MESKKVILFIVEGSTDKNSLSLILYRLLNNVNVKFHVVGGDVTSEKETSVKNCIVKVTNEIKSFLEENKYDKKDIIKIVHLVDTDGAFVNNDKIIMDEDVKIKYTLDSILTKNIENIVERNNRKSSVIDKLYNLDKVYNIDYFMYYFSCNLEHVLHNEENINDHLKEEYSDKFLDKYINNERKFIEFICTSNFSMINDYVKSWEFIKKDTNSLKRYCNLGLLFKSN